jgi:hypothetical protein
MQRIAGMSTVEGVVIDWAVAQPVSTPRLPVFLLSREQKARELQRLQARRAMDAAYEAELIMGLADDSPELPDDHPAAQTSSKGSWSSRSDLPGVAESFNDELSIVLNCGRGTAAHHARRAWTYRENLPATWAALAAGTLDEPRARDLADALEHASPAIARGIETELLPEASGLSRTQLKKRALALLLEREPEAREATRRQARKGADVRTYLSPLDGMGTLAADMPVEESAACLDIVNTLAQMLKADGDPRPIGELRSAVMSALLRRPWDDSRPAVTAHLHITASLASLEGRSAEAAQVDNLSITAAHLRELLRRLGALGPGGLRSPEGGSLTFAITDDDGALLAAVSLKELERLARRGCPDHPGTNCACPVLQRPPATEAYGPTAAQRRFVRTRDRTCRFPNCGQRAGWADLDHVVPHARGGKTDCANLCCLCRSHHRLKTQGENWRFVMTDDGVLSVTTPSGVTRTTRPPGLRPPRPEPPPSTEPAPPPALPDDDPPPF